MRVNISIEDDGQKDMKIVWAVTDTTAKGLPIMPVILSLLRFAEHQLQLCDLYIKRKHPMLRQYDGPTQDKLITTVHHTATISDLNPKPDTDSKLKIAK